MYQMSQVIKQRNYDVYIVKFYISVKESGTKLQIKYSTDGTLLS